MPPLLQKQMQNYLTTKLNHHPLHKYNTKNHSLPTPKDQILQLLSLKQCIYEYENTIDQIRQTPSLQPHTPLFANSQNQQHCKRQRRKIQPKKTAELKLEQRKKVHSQRFLRQREVIENQKQELLRGSSQATYNKDRSRLNSNKTKLTCNSIQINKTSTKKGDTLIHKKAKTLSNFHKASQQTIQEKRDAEMRLKSFIGNYRSKYRCETAKVREGDIQHKKIEEIVMQITKQQRMDSHQDQHFESVQAKGKNSESIIFKNASVEVKLANFPNPKKLVRQQKLKKGGLLKQRYAIVQKIGKGLSGEVFKGRDILTQKFVAIKMSENHEKKEREYEFYKRVQHRNIVNYLNNFIENGKRYLVLQYFPFTLESILKKRKFDQIQVKKVFKYLASALMYLHGLSIAHRDIKLQNIVCSEDLSVVKFIDFGLCIDLNEEEGQLSKQFCGTVHYMPPEILQLRPYCPKKADIWSLGVLLYKLCFDRFPYRGKDQREILQKVHRTKLVFPSGCNLDLKDLLEQMLDKSAVSRASVSEVVEHRWLL